MHRSRAALAGCTRRRPLMLVPNVLRETVRRFAVDRIAPVIADYYDRHEFPYELVKQMGAMGLFYGISFALLLLSARLKARRRAGLEDRCA